MAADYDIINRSKQHGNNIVRLADLLAEATAIANKEKTCADHMVADNGDKTVLVAQFGLDPTVDAANFVTLLGNVQSALAASGVTEFIARVSGQ